MKDQLRMGEIDSVNPQTRQSDRQADKTKRERRGKEAHSQNRRADGCPRHILSPLYGMCTLEHLDISPAVHHSSISAMHTSSPSRQEKRKKNQRKVITIIPLLSVINRQAGASMEEGFKCLFTLK